MKKCPYCKTLTNDDVNQCPNCLHDISTLKPMPSAFNKNSSRYYTIIFGIIFIFGGFIAGVTQFNNYNHYLNLANESDLSEEKINELLSLASNSRLEMTLMFILSFLGVVMVIISLIRLFRKK